MNFFKKRPILFSLLVAILFLILANKLSRYYLNKINPASRLQSEFILSIYGKNNYDDYFKVIQEGQGYLKYQPFTEFKEPERKGTFVTVNKSGIRSNEISPVVNENPKGGLNEIWVFGGSTTFGYGVKNDETIPAWLEKIVKNKKVFNISSALWYSTQERIRYLNMVSTLPSPYATIFIDGLNDSGHFTQNTKFSRAIEKKMNISDMDLFLALLKKNVERQAFTKLLRKISKNRQTNKNQNEPATSNEIKKSVYRLSNNHLINAIVSNNKNIKNLNILQPVPIYDHSYKNSNIPKNYPKLPKSDYENIKLFYNYIENYSEFGKEYMENYLDLSKLKIDGAMYIDNVHYSPAFNKKIAEIIKDTLKLE